jgi:NADPH-dependent 2,4-dienoyl-CoA reductase/sulfur reductase-like enzyme
MSARVVVLGAGAAGLSVANRLAAAHAAGTEIAVVDRAGEHVFWPGLTGVLFGDTEPAAIRRPLGSLLADGRRRTDDGRTNGAYQALTAAGRARLCARPELPAGPEGPACPL